MMKLFDIIDEMQQKKNEHLMTYYWFNRLRRADDFKQLVRHSAKSLTITEDKAKEVLMACRGLLESDAVNEKGKKSARKTINEMIYILQNVYGFKQNPRGKKNSKNKFD